MRQGGAAELESPTVAAIVCALVTLALSMPLMAAPRLLGPAPTPILPVITVYFWTVLRPSLLPAPVVFLAGLALDLLTATPLGFWALSLLTASIIARLVRPFTAPPGAAFPRRIGGAALAVAGAALGGLVALSAADRLAEPSWTQLVQLIFTIAVYPILESVYLALARAAGLGRGRA